MESPHACIAPPVGTGASRIPVVLAVAGQRVRPPGQTRRKCACSAGQRQLCKGARVLLLAGTGHHQTRHSPTRRSPRDQRYVPSIPRALGSVECVAPPKATQPVGRPCFVATGRCRHRCFVAQVHYHNWHTFLGAEIALTTPFDDQKTTNFWCRLFGLESPQQRGRNVRIPWQSALKN